MRIDGHGANLGTKQVQPSSGAAEPAKPAAAARTAGGGDRVVLSPAAAQGQTAPLAAEGTEIRADLVARMRVLRDAGTLGRDAGRLADALLDRLVTKP